MDYFRSVMGFDPYIMDSLHELLDFPDESDKSQHHPSGAYIREAKAMAATQADVKDCPNAFVIVIDMPGLKPDQVKVQVEEGNLLVVSGERKREKEKDQGVNYIKMERRLGKYLKKFQLPENADTEKGIGFLSRWGLDCDSGEETATRAQETQDGSSTSELRSRRSSACIHMVVVFQIRAV